MRSTCDGLWRMSKMIQIRNVPDELHRTLKVRAGKAGMTLYELRRQTLLGTLSSRRSAEAILDLKNLAFIRYPHATLVDRIWRLKDNLTAYVALAEALDAPLVTMDARLAQASGIQAAVEAYH
jgi:predicted nucleic acid-binding protein